MHVSLGHLNEQTARRSAKPITATGLFRRDSLALLFTLSVSLAPCVAQEPSAADDGAGAVIRVDAETLTRLPSPWADYFGTHYASTPEGAGRWWNTVRSYGGTHAGAYPTDQSEIHVGPFTGREVRVGLADFHSRLNRAGKSAEQLIPELIEHRLTAIYQMTTIVRPSLEPFDKDLAYWTVYPIHKRFPQASRYVAWQIGNEVVSGHFDPKGQRQDTGIPEEAKQGQFHGYDLDWKEDYYVEDYLAPAVDAIERASREAYGDAGRIKVLLGSMNPYNRQNIEFLQNVMARTFSGKNAPTLAGDPVTDHIDVLTVHYMFGGERTVQRMQQYVDDYLRTGKVEGIWATEDHGRAGKGPVTILDRGFRFMAWVARNRLTSDQARLVWWGDGAPKPGGSARDVEVLLGDFLFDSTLHFREQPHAGGRVYVISDSAEGDCRRVLVAIVPDRGAAMVMEGLELAFSEDLLEQAWQAQAMQYTAEKAPEAFETTVECQGNTLAIQVDREVSAPLVLLLQATD